MLFSVLAILLMITVSIGLPIYFRPFYYAHISAMNLEYESGYSKAEIIDAYNEVLDYLTLPGREFGAGVMAYSESGKDHFVDCKALFDLNATVLLISAATVITILILKKRKKLELCELGTYHPLFYSGLGAILIPSCLGLLIATDFSRAFTVFHKIFFPGKENFYFDPYTDGIILILPLEFFARCGILIGSVITLSCVGFIAYGIIEKKKAPKI